MNRTLIFALCLTLCAGIVFGAVEVNVNGGPDFDRGVIVTSVITGCPGIANLKITSPEPRLVYVNQDNTLNWNSNYNTNSNAQKGKYTITVACIDGTQDTTEFCVESPGCTNGQGNNIPVQNNQPIGNNNQPANQNNNNAGGGGDGSGGGGGGGRPRCQSVWECNPWTFCTEMLVQTRDCFDKNRCAEPKIESRGCVPCRESWACGAWANCESNVEKRTCIDDFDCGTKTIKPIEERRCGEPDYGPQPARISDQIVPPGQVGGRNNVNPKITGTIQSELEEKTPFWVEYKVILILIVIAMIIVGIIILFFHFHKKAQPKVVYSHDAIVEWIKKERAAGSTDMEIKTILKENTGLNQDEIALALTSASSTTPIPARATNTTTQTTVQPTQNNSRIVPITPPVKIMNGTVNNQRTITNVSSMPPPQKK